MASRSRENESERHIADLSSIKPNVEAMKPKMPSFEDYFSAQAEGIHPFDRVANQQGEDLDSIGNEEDAWAEAEREQKLYKRSLLGKLLGQKLTPEEFEILSGIDVDGSLRNKRTLDVNNEEFMDKR